MHTNWETFFGAYKNTIAALEAFSTLAVVIVSLVLALIAQRANRTRVKAYAQISTIHHALLEGQQLPSYITVHITNNGIMPVIIPFSFFYWHVILSKSGWQVNPWDYSQGDQWVPQKQYPVEIKARATQVFFLSERTYSDNEMRTVFAGANFIERCRFYFIQARIVTDDGKVFSVKLSDSLRKSLRELLAAAA